MFEKYIKILLFDFIGALCLGVSLHCFVLSAHFAPGGVTGLSVIFNYLFKIPIGTAIVLVNIPIIIFTFYKIKLNFLLMSLKSIVICSLLLDYVVCYFPAYSGNRMISTLYASIFAGIGYSLLFNEGSSSGGTDFIVVFFKKINPKYSFGFLVFCINILIIILYTFLFKNYLSFLYGLIYTCLTSILMDFTSRVLDCSNNLNC